MSIRRYEFVVWSQSELKNTNLALKLIGALLSGVCTVSHDASFHV